MFLGNLSLANKRGRRREGLQFDFFLVHYYNSQINSNKHTGTWPFLVFKLLAYEVKINLTKLTEI